MTGKRIALSVAATLFLFSLGMSLAVANAISAISGPVTTLEVLNNTDTATDWRLSTVAPIRDTIYTPAATVESGETFINSRTVNDWPLAPDDQNGLNIHQDSTHTFALNKLRIIRPV